MRDDKATTESGPSKPAAPLPQKVYGTLIYWLSIISAAVCAVGPVIAVAAPGNNVINPHFLFYSIWQGTKPRDVWTTSGAEFPGGHFWMSSLTRGDGLTQLGLVIGCSCAAAALIGTAIAYLTKRHRSLGWAFASLFAACMIVLALLGIYQAPAA